MRTEDHSRNEELSVLACFYLFHTDPVAASVIGGLPEQKQICSSFLMVRGPRRDRVTVKERRRIFAGNSKKPGTMSCCKTIYFSLQKHEEILECLMKLFNKAMAVFKAHT